MSSVAEPRQNVHFSSNGREVSGYLSVPDSGSGPGVIVVQEWWGLDDHIVSICDRLAADGFVALAPDLYGGRVVHEVDDATEMLQKLPVDQAAADLSESDTYLLGLDSVTGSRVGIVGFCMGGGFALLFGAQHGDQVGAVVSYYGVGPGVPDTYAGLTADVQGHYGEQDAMYPVADARKQEEQIARESSGSVEFFYYPAGHAFNNDEDHIGTYDPDAAGLAWGRTLAFLHSHFDMDA